MKHESCGSEYAINKAELMRPGPTAKMLHHSNYCFGCNPACRSLMRTVDRSKTALDQLNSERTKSRLNSIGLDSVPSESPSVYLFTAI